MQWFLLIAAASLVGLIVLLAIKTGTRSTTMSLPQQQVGQTREMRDPPALQLRYASSGSRKAFVGSMQNEKENELIQFLASKYFQIIHNTQLIALQVFLSSLRPGDMALITGTEVGQLSFQDLQKIPQGVRIILLLNGTSAQVLGLKYVSTLPNEQSNSDRICSMPLSSATLQVRTATEVVDTGVEELAADIVLFASHGLPLTTEAFTEILKRYPFTFNVTLGGTVVGMNSLLSNAECDTSVQLALSKNLSLSSVLSAWGL